MATATRKKKNTVQWWYNIVLFKSKYSTTKTIHSCIIRPQVHTRTHTATPALQWFYSYTFFKSTYQHPTNTRNKKEKENKKCELYTVKNEKTKNKQDFCKQDEQFYPKPLRQTAAEPRLIVPVLIIRAIITYTLYKAQIHNWPFYTDFTTQPPKHGYNG